MSLSSRSWFRGLAATSAAIVVVVAGGAAALADDISNALDGTVDATAESMTLAAGGATATTTLRVIEVNGDGKQGCNLTGQTTLTTAVGSSNTAVATVSPSSVTFTSCSDTKVLTVTSIAAGSATVTLSQTSNDTNGTFNLAPATFTVTVSAPAPTRTATTTTVTCPTPPTTYTGSALEPCSALTSGSGGFQQVATVSYTDNTNVGTAHASAAFTGDSNHLASSGAATFAIAEAPSTTTVTCPPGVVWTGAPQTPCSATVTGAGGLNESPTPDYSSNTAVGTATASFTFAGDTNHVGSSDSKTFQITKANTTVTVTCTGAPFTYTGAAQEPCSATVTGPGGLNEAVAVAYQNNTDAGTAIASATYNGDASHIGDSDSEQFTIGQAASTVTVTCPQHVTYTGTALTPCTATATGAGKLSADLTGSITYGANTNAGDATASATYDGDTNHTASTGAGAFTIDKAPSSVSILCTDPVTYTGSPLEVCGATAAGAGIPTPVALTVSYTDNTNAGSGHASAAWTGDANHDGSAAATTFSIARAGTVTTVTCPASVNYTGSAITPCTAAVTGPGGLDQPLSVTYTSNVGVGTATASASYAGSGNYEPSSGSSTFKVASWWTLKGFYQPVDLGGVVNTVKAGSTVPLKFEVFAGTTELTSTSAVKSFTVNAVSCAGTAVLDDIELTTTGGTSLRYDTTGGQFIQNWQTPKTAGTCYRVTMTTQDLSTISALFKLK